MTSPPPEPFDVVVVGAGPAGVVAALRAARLGARTALITRDQFGGMAANDGPVPVRTLAQAARLIREARKLPHYGIAASEPALDYPRLLARVREVTAAAREQTLLRGDLERAGVIIYEQAGPARFADAHTIESGRAPRLRAGKVILCTGGTSRPLPVPGSGLTATHSDAWNLSSVPPSMLVIGAGATGVQVASIFNAFGSRVHLVEVGPRILMSEDRDVSGAVAAALAASGVQIVQDAGTIDRFERCAAGVRMVRSPAGGQQSIEAALAVVAAGWVADTAGARTHGLPARRGGPGVLWRSPLPAAADRAHDHSGAEPDDDQIDDHLAGDHQPCRLSGGGDVAEADGGEHRDGEVQGVRAGHGLAEAAGRDAGDDHVAAGEQQQEERHAGGEGLQRPQPGELGGDDRADLEGDQRAERGQPDRQHRDGGPAGGVVQWQQVVDNHQHDGGTRRP